VLTTKEMKQR